MAEYKVQFEVFEGPLDLLLYLIKKEEVDIYEVNLTKMATQFIEYIEVMRMLDLDIAGEFLVMASTLMYIKSRELLPRDLQPENSEEEEGEEEKRLRLQLYPNSSAVVDQARQSRQKRWQTRCRQCWEPNCQPRPFMSMVSSFRLPREQWCEECT